MVWCFLLESDDTWSWYHLITPWVYVRQIHTGHKICLVIGFYMLCTYPNFTRPRKGILVEIIQFDTSLPPSTNGCPHSTFTSSSTKRWGHKSRIYQTDLEVETHQFESIHIGSMYGVYSANSARFTIKNQLNVGSYTNTWWWFQLFIFTPTWGNDPIWLICSIGLVQPPTRIIYRFSLDPNENWRFCVPDRPGLAMAGRRFWTKFAPLKGMEAQCSQMLHVWIIYLHKVKKKWSHSRGNGLVDIPYMEHLGLFFGGVCGRIMGRVTLVGKKMHTWNPNDSYLDLKSLCFGGFNHQKGGQGVTCTRLLSDLYT